MSPPAKKQKLVDDTQTSHPDVGIGARLCNDPERPYLALLIEPLRDSSKVRCRRCNRVYVVSCEGTVTRHTESQSCMAAHAENLAKGKAAEAAFDALMANNNRQGDEEDDDDELAANNDSEDEEDEEEAEAAATATTIDNASLAQIGAALIRRQKQVDENEEGMLQQDELVEKLQTENGQLKAELTAITDEHNFAKAALAKLTNGHISAIAKVTGERDEALSALAKLNAELNAANERLAQLEALAPHVTAMAAAFAAANQQ
jgi:chromosome segregation ATPase